MLGRVPVTGSLIGRYSHGTNGCKQVQSSSCLHLPGNYEPVSLHDDQIGAPMNKILKVYCYVGGPSHSIRY